MTAIARCFSYLVYVVILRKKQTSCLENCYGINRLTKNNFYENKYWIKRKRYRCSSCNFE